MAPLLLLPLFIIQLAAYAATARRRSASAPPPPLLLSIRLHSSSALRALSKMTSIRKGVVATLLPLLPLRALLLVGVMGSEPGSLDGGPGSWGGGGSFLSEFSSFDFGFGLIGSFSPAPPGSPPPSELGCSDTFRGNTTSRICSRRSQQRLHMQTALGPCNSVADPGRGKCVDIFRHNPCRSTHENDDGGAVCVGATAPPLVIHNSSCSMHDYSREVVCVSATTLSAVVPSHSNSLSKLKRPVCAGENNIYKERRRGDLASPVAPEDAGFGGGFGSESGLFVAGSAESKC